MISSLFVVQREWKKFGLRLLFVTLTPMRHVHIVLAILLWEKVIVNRIAKTSRNTAFSSPIGKWIVNWPFNIIRSNMQLSVRFGWTNNWTIDWNKWSMEMCYEIPNEIPYRRIETIRLKFSLHEKDGSLNSLKAKSFMYRCVCGTQQSHHIFLSCSIVVQFAVFVWSNIRCLLVSFSTGFSISVSEQ